MVSTDGPPEVLANGISCAGSGSIPDIFNDVAERVRFGACSVCGIPAPVDCVVRNH